MPAAEYPALVVPDLRGHPTQLARRLAGCPLPRGREQIGDGADRGGHQAVERPSAPLLTLEEPGFGQNPEVVTHSRLRESQWRCEVTHARLAVRRGLDQT